MKNSNPSIVFFCSSPARGGLELNVGNLATALAKRGNNVIIYSPKNTLISEIAENNQIQIRYFPEHSKYFDFKKAKMLANMLIEDNCKYLIITHNQDMEFGAIAKFFNHNFKLIFHQQMHIGRRKKDPIHNWRFNRYDYWISPLQIIADDMLRLTNIDPKKIKIIPLGVDPNRLHNANISKSEARKMLNLPDDKFIVGIIGRIDQQKGQHIFLEALNYLKADFPNIYGVISGEITQGHSDRYFQTLQEYIHQNHLENFVQFINYQKDIQIFYSAIDCFVLASSSETYGMVTVEALMSGIPVIATNSGGTPEIINYGEYGFLYTPNSSLELSQKIALTIQNQSQILQMAKNAQKIALENFTIEIECKKFEEIFT